MQEYYQDTVFTTPLVKKANQQPSQTDYSRRNKSPISGYNHPNDLNEELTNLKSDKVRSNSTNKHKQQRLEPLMQITEGQNRIMGKRYGADLFYRFKQLHFQEIDGDKNGNEGDKMENMTVNEKRMFLPIAQGAKTVSNPSALNINVGPSGNDVFTSYLYKIQMKKTGPYNEDEELDLNKMMGGTEQQMDSRDPRVFQALFTQKYQSKLT